MWQPNEGATFPWAPFRDDFTVGSGSLAPHICLTEARASGQIPVSLIDKCADYLRVIWEGNAAAMLGVPFFHTYSIAESPARFWEMWRRHPLGQTLHSERTWACRNLRDAGEKYSWTGGELDFPLLALALQVAVSKCDQLRTAALCLKILDWGGVRHKVGNMQPWLFKRAFENMLCRDLVDATARLIPRSSACLQDFDGDTYLMNSSSIKLYAAMALDLSRGLDAARQDVLIYDARVAAGLAFITRLTLERSGMQSVPDDLSYPVERAPGRRRDPSSASFLFPPFAVTAAGHRARAKFARIGSRYVQEIIRSGGPSTEFALAKFARIGSRYVQEIIRSGGPSTEFALAEKGLFMIGYDVRSSRPIPIGKVENRDVHGFDSNKSEASVGTGCGAFKRRAVELHRSGKPQSQAIIEAARELDINLPASYIDHPGSHFDRWRKQGIV
ncbi:hypothetical protein [Massilia sp. LC238]|uniref:hypothetical protein n=1 Tax=Massilia sp. LC238 TaxID=1502852 RepID=UPI001269EA9E|nr:hypothetical protein [Massilia sp. LC238]